MGRSIWAVVQGCPVAPPSTLPMGWCGGRCSSSGTWRCTHVLADTPWRALEGAGVWRTAPGRRLPHAEVERTRRGLCPFPRMLLPQLTVPFAHDAMLLLSFLILCWTPTAYLQQTLCSVEDINFSVVKKGSFTTEPLLYCCTVTDSSFCALLAL